MTKQEEYKKFLEENAKIVDSWPKWKNIPQLPIDALIETEINQNKEIDSSILFQVDQGKETLGQIIKELKNYPESKIRQNTWVLIDRGGIRINYRL